MRYILFLFVVFTSSLSACTPARGVPSSSQTLSVCLSVASRARFDDRPFTSLLAHECQSAAQRTLDDSDPISAWYASLYLQQLSEFEEIISGLEYPVSRTGEYLIAREAGLLTALDQWILSSNYAERSRTQAETKS